MIDKEEIPKNTPEEIAPEVDPLTKRMEELKEENKAILNTLKNKKSDPEEKKERKKIADALTDKPDVLDLNESLGDRIEELNKTLKTLTSGLGTGSGGGGGIGNLKGFLSDMAPILATLLIANNFSGSDGGIGGTSGVGGSRGGIWNGKNFGDEGELGNIEVPPSLEEIGGEVVKTGLMYGAKKITGEGAKRSIPYIAKTAAHAREINAANVAAKQAFNARKIILEREVEAAKAAEQLASNEAAILRKKALDSKKLWSEVAETAEDPLMVKTAKSMLSGDRLVLQEEKVFEGFVNKGITSAATKEAEKKLAEHLVKGVEKVVVKNTVSTSAKIIAAKAIPFLEFGVRGWLLYENFMSGDWTAFKMEATAAGLSAAAYGLAATGVGAGAAVGLRYAASAVDVANVGVGIYSAFQPKNVVAPKGVIGTPYHCITYFTKNGLTIEAACGIAGNLQVESGFNSSADTFYKGKYYYGVAQWDDARREGTINGRMDNTSYNNSFLRVYGKKMQSVGLEDQYAFIIYELRQMGGIAALNSCKSPEEAAEWFDIKYERSSGAMRQERKSNARLFYDKFNKTRTGKSVPSKVIPKPTQKTGNTDNGFNLKGASPQTTGLQRISRNDQEKINTNLKNKKPLSSAVTGNQGDNVIVNKPTTNSSNIIGNVTTDPKGSHWYERQNRTGCFNAFPGEYKS